MSKTIWQVRDHADGWIPFESHDEAVAYSLRESGSLLRSATVLEFDWRRKTGKYEYGWNLWLADGIMVGTLDTPSQSKNYTGPKWRGEVLLPGIRIRPGLLHETELEAATVVEQAVIKWFQTTGVAVAARGPKPPVLQR